MLGWLQRNARDFAARRLLGRHSHATFTPTARCFEIVNAALEEAGCSLADIVRTRAIPTDIENGKAAKEVRKAVCFEAWPVDTVMAI